MSKCCTKSVGNSVVHQNSNIFFIFFYHQVQQIDRVVEVVEETLKGKCDVIVSLDKCCENFRKMLVLLLTLNNLEKNIPNRNKTLSWL